MTTIALDGLSEEDFRRSIENRLREGQPNEAVGRLRRLLAPYAGPGGILPERFLTVTAEDFRLSGWQALEAAIARHDRPGNRITALSVAFGWPGEEPPKPDAAGNLRPLIEVGYFNDDAYPFSQSGRDDLLDGYSIHGCTWAADCVASDNALTLDGIDDLHGALAALEARLLASEEPDEAGILAGSLGSCLLSALLYQAVSERVERDGLPRPLCVMAGSNGVYPYFDAPVAGFPEEARKAAEREDEAFDQGAPAPRYSSLLMTAVPRARKRAVLVLEETEQEMAARLAQLRGIDQSDEPAVDNSPAAPELPEPGPGSPLMAKKDHGPAWDFRDMLGPPPVWPEAGAAASPEPESPDTARDLSDSAWPEPDWSEEDWPETSLAGEEPLDPEAAEQPAMPEPSWSEAEWPEAEPDGGLYTEDFAPVAESPEPEVLAPELSESGWSEPDRVDQGVELEAPPMTEQFEPIGESPAQEADTPAGPGFELLEPMLEANIQEQLRALMAPYVSPETPEPEVSADPANAYEGPFWPAGPGWVEAEVVTPPTSTATPQHSGEGLWARLRGWLKRSS